MVAMKTSTPSWKTLLTLLQQPAALQPQNNLPRVAIVGIGNEFNGDDAVGVLVARRLSKCEYAADAGHVLVIEAGQAPENITGELRRFNPQVVILVDAAQMDAPPGRIAWIPWETTSGMSASSHSLPLSMLARYLTLEFGCTVHLLGIQPAQNHQTGILSTQARAATNEVTNALAKELFLRK
jgi:hydrogenase 3 maturation protease